MTIIILTALITVLCSYFLYKPIHKYNIYMYTTFALLSLLLREESNLVTLGYIPFGIFLVVMFSGVLNKGVLRKRLFMVRAELAIIASILLFPHAFGYLEYFLDDIGIFNGDVSFYIGFISFLVLIPLFLTSFRFIRKRFSYTQWKTIHQLSYFFYLFVGLHLIFINNDRQIAYIVLFVSYTLLKVSMTIHTKTNKKHPKTTTS